MAKKINTFNDVLAALTNTNAAVVEEAKAKTISRKKTDITNIAADIFEIDAQLAALDKESGEFESNVKELKAKRSHLARQRFATAFSNISKAELDDRSEEGIAALRKKMEDTRYGLYLAEYEGKVPEKMTIAGKEQDSKFKAGGAKGGQYKFAAWSDTKRTWNIGSQLIGNVATYGWAEIFKSGKVTPYAEVQRWSVDENGEIVKEKPSQKGNASTPSKDGYELLLQTIATLEQRLNRKDVDLTSKKGEEIADKAMIAISKAVTAAKAAKK